MITRTYYYTEESTDPFYNLGIEQHLLDIVPKGSCILYLWQNKHTVVIGKNQNCWKECKMQELADDGGRMVRRLSGGGAVYHDLGNLNFTFVTHKEDYDVARQLDVILTALHALGIHAEKSGRNDLHADGRKFSGNAFYDNGSRCFHHGTLMVDVDKDNLSKYLQVSPGKLSGKGVDSVQARVVNLKELKPDLTIAQLKTALIQAMEVVYQCEIEEIDEFDLDEVEIAAHSLKFGSDQFRLGQRIPFTWEVEHRFVWGDIQLQCEVDAGKIKTAVIYSDALDNHIIEAMASHLQGCAFGSKPMAERLQQMSARWGNRQELLDVCQYLQELNV
jgi:lipoate-protein ligase A